MCKFVSSVLNRWRISKKDHFTASQEYQFLPKSVDDGPLIFESFIKRFLTEKSRERKEIKLDSKKEQEATEKWSHAYTATFMRFSLLSPRAALRPFKMLNDFGFWNFAARSSKKRTHFLRSTFNGQSRINEWRKPEQQEVVERTTTSFVTFLFAGGPRERFWCRVLDERRLIKWN